MAGDTTGDGRRRAAEHDETEDALKVTGKRATFLRDLRLGDVLLFQGADFLAGLAQLTERRTCYHSAIYVGTQTVGGGTKHLLAHNVSSLWWRDLANQPGRGGSRTAVPPGVDLRKDPAALRQYLEELSTNLAHHHLIDPEGTLIGETEARAAQLVDRGGVGIVSIEDYLDRCRTEWLYGRRDHTGKKRRVRHVRSAIALRHASIVEEDDPGRQRARRRDLVDAARRVARQATAFNAAELLSVVPDCFARPGYYEMLALEAVADAVPNLDFIAALLDLPRPNPVEHAARRLVGDRLRTIDPVVSFRNVAGPGWICASYVIATYRDAGLPLDVDTVEAVEMLRADGTKGHLSTPRDLWDCADLVPIVLFARGPERWRAGPRTPPAHPSLGAADASRHRRGRRLRRCDHRRPRRDHARAAARRGRAAGLLRGRRPHGGAGAGLALGPGRHAAGRRWHRRATTHGRAGRRAPVDRGR